MTDQLSVEFDKQDAGHADVEKRFSPEEVRTIERWVIECGRREFGVTSDDARACLPLPLLHKVQVTGGNVMGFCFRRLSKAGRIRRKDCAARVATHQDSRGRSQPVWETVE